MNTKQANTLRGLLKKYSIKDASNMVRLAMGCSFDKLTREADPLYIIPRIASCYDEKKQSTFTTMYKEWLKEVVERGWVDELAPYIEESGVHAVTQAIYYLIDHSLWRTYEGRLALGHQEREDYYEGLTDLPSAIAQVIELNPGLAPKKDEPKEEQKAATSSSQEEVINAANEADTAIESLIDKIHLITDYVKNNVDTGDSSQKTELMKKRIEEQKKRIAELKKQIAEKDDTLQKQSDCISKLKEESKQQDGYYKELHDKYNALLDERDAISKENDTYAKMLEEAAQYEQMPKKKVIPESVLLDVPLLGYGVLKGLRHTLERFNIYIDSNR